mmetsp:Transcript_48302/g.117011  ORF Transcript_48302/g.117011 Transcript_48302/m.117011 type:complete len:174 (+) Transcript_48302:191-712(+)
MSSKSNKKKVETKTAKTPDPAKDGEKGEEEKEEQTTAWFGIINSKQTPWQEDLDKKVQENAAKKTKLPPLKDLLKYGDPDRKDDDDTPKTWWDIYGPPIQLFVVFVLSLVVFHYLKDYAPRKQYNIPGMQRLPIFDQDIQAMSMEDKMRLLQHQRRQKAAGGADSGGETGAEL